MHNLSGKQLKGYRVLRRLGRGAMAEVFLAEQTSLGRQVALKVLNAELASDPAYVERFDREARAAAALVHAGIVQIYEVGEADGVHFIAQEYVPGRNLGEIIRREGRLPPGQALDIIRQVAAALHKAAQHGIVHRDIKPENILITVNGEVKVADFGLARVMTTQTGNELTQIGITMGTPLYMSPEQIEGRSLDSRSDIYSLGVTAYHMLTGEPPFKGDTPLAVAVLHLNERPKPLESAGDDIPPGLARIVHRMIDKKPDSRPASPAELLAQLRDLAAVAYEQGWGRGLEDWSAVELSAVAGRSGATAKLGELMKESTRLNRRRRTLARWLAIAAACVLAGVAMAWLSRPAPLLATARSGPPGPPARKTVLAQLYYAATTNTEAAWLSVEEHFPDASSYHRDLATQGLIRYYLLRSREYDKAVPYLQELADRSSDDLWSRAFSYTGLAIAYTWLGQPEAASTAIEQLTSETSDVLRERDAQLWEAWRATRQVFYDQTPQPPIDGSSD